MDWKITTQGGRNWQTFSGRKNGYKVFVKCLFAISHTFFHPVVKQPLLFTQLQIKAKRQKQALKL